MRTQLIATSAALALCLVHAAAAKADSGGPRSPETSLWRTTPCCPDPAATQPPTDGTGSGASFGRELQGIAYDADDGFLYVADLEGDVIRRVSTAGVVTTFAGDCERNVTSGDCQGDHVDGNRLIARFDEPDSIAYDPVDRSLYVTERGARDVRRIGPDGVVSTVSWAELVAMPLSIAYDGTSSTMDMTDGYHILELTSAGVTNVIRSDTSVYGLTFDTVRRRLIYEDLSSIGTLDANGSKQRLAGACIQDARGDIWTGCHAGTVDGAGTDAVFNHIQGLAFDGKDGAVYVADWNAIRRMTPVGVVTTVAGGCAGSVDDAIKDCPEGNLDGPKATASFGIVRGIAYDSRDDVLFVVDEPNREIRRVGLDGIVKTIAGSPTNANDQVSAWSADYAWRNAHERLVVQVRGHQELELFYKDGQLFEIRSGRRSAEYLSDFKVFSILSSHVTSSNGLPEVYDGFARDASYNGPDINGQQAIEQLGCTSFGAYTASDGHVAGGDTTLGKWTLQSSASSNCRALRVVDPSGNVDFHDFERSDIPHKDPTPQWVRLS